MTWCLDFNLLVLELLLSIVNFGLLARSMLHVLIILTLVILLVQLALLWTDHSLRLRSSPLTLWLWSRTATFIVVLVGTRAATAVLDVLSAQLA
jgi:hypothetical protein